METKFNVGDAVSFAAKIDKIVVEKLGASPIALYYLEGIDGIGFTEKDLQDARLEWAAEANMKANHR